MIKIIPHLTCNQAMVLLDIYRGSFEENRHMATVKGDLGMLLFHLYIEIEEDGKEYKVTNHGENRVREILC